jgi:predicted nucleic acid-binding protein
MQAMRAKLQIAKLTEIKKEGAFEISTHIAHYPQSKNRTIESHLGEAQTIMLAGRFEHHDDVLLMDERIARKIAQQRGVNLSGFPGVLLLATQIDLITPTELKTKLEICRAQGTHYGGEFIQQVFEIACLRR